MNSPLICQYLRDSGAKKEIRTLAIHHSDVLREKKEAENGLTYRQIVNESLRTSKKIQKQNQKIQEDLTKERTRIQQELTIDLAKEKKVYSAILMKPQQVFSLNLFFK
jgi:hypothetical protein